MLEVTMAKVLVKLLLRSSRPAYAEFVRAKTVVAIAVLSEMYVFLCMYSLMYHWLLSSTV